MPLSAGYIFEKDKWQLKIGATFFAGRAVEDNGIGSKSWVALSASVGWRLHKRVVLSLVAGADLVRIGLSGQTLQVKNTEGKLYELITESKNITDPTSPFKTSFWQIEPFVGAELHVRVHSNFYFTTDFHFFAPSKKEMGVVGFKAMQDYPPSKKGDVLYYVNPEKRSEHLPVKRKISIWSYSNISARATIGVMYVMGGEK